MNRIVHYIVEALIDEREAIRAAAIRFADGTVYEGPFHAHCWMQAREDGLVDYEPDEDVDVGDLQAIYDVRDGFVTTSGRFVDRGEAFRISMDAKQIPREEPGLYPAWLDSGDVQHSYATESEDFSDFVGSALSTNPENYGAHLYSTSVSPWSISKKYEAYLKHPTEEVVVSFTLSNSIDAQVPSRVEMSVGIVGRNDQEDRSTIRVVRYNHKPGSKPTEHAVEAYRTIKTLQSDMEELSNAGAEAIIDRANERMRELADESAKKRVSVAESEDLSDFVGSALAIDPTSYGARLYSSSKYSQSIVSKYELYLSHPTEEVVVYFNLGRSTDAQFQSWFNIRVCVNPPDDQIYRSTITAIYYSHKPGPESTDCAVAAYRTIKTLQSDMYELSDIGAEAIIELANFRLRELANSSAKDLSDTI